MIKPCLILLSCLQTNLNTGHSKYEACAIDAKDIVLVYNSEYSKSTSVIQTRSLKYERGIAETPSQVIEKVNNCK